MEQKPHHHILLGTGVSVFTAMIVIFWAMGLPDIFGNAKSGENPLAESKNSWDEIFRQAEQTQESIRKQTAALSKEMDTERTLEKKLKAMLAAKVTAQALTAPTTAPTSTSN